MNNAFQYSHCSGCNQWLLVIHVTHSALFCIMNVYAVPLLLVI